MSYSVLIEPLIAVVPKDGQLPVEVSLRDAIVHAHEYADIAGDSPMEQFAVVRFLSAFVMDMLAMKTPEDRRKIFKAGKISEKDFDDYIALCRREGASFDLYDSAAPFMQTPFSPEEQKKKMKAAATIDLYLPSGNNHVFFTFIPVMKGYAVENDAALTPPKAFRCLCVRQTFCAYSMEGPGGIAVMPLFLYTAGSNLFETVLMQTLSEEEATKETGLEYGIGTVPWRKGALEVTSKARIDTPTFLQALTWQPRMIQLFPGKDGMIRRICLASGMDGKGIPWKDINTFSMRLVNRKTGEVTLRTIMPRYDQDAWLNLLGMAYDDDNLYEKSACVRNLPALFGGKAEGQITLRMCGIQKHSTNYKLLAVLDEETPLPETVYEDKAVIRGIWRDVRLLTKTAYDIRGAVRKLFDEKNDTRCYQCSMKFCQAARELLMTLTAEDLLANIPPQEHADRFCEAVKEIIPEVIRYMRGFAGTGSRALLAVSEAEKNIRFALWRNIKERKEENEDGEDDASGTED